MENKIELPIPYSAMKSEEEQLKFISLVRSYREDIKCLYFPLGYLEEGRGVYGIRAPDSDSPYDPSIGERLLQEILKEVGVPVKILINDLHSTVVHEKWPLVRSKIEYYRSFCTVLSIVIADISILRYWDKELPPVCLSTNAYSSFEMLATALTLDTNKYIKEIVIARDYNRDIKTLTKIKVRYKDIFKGKQFIVMVNEGCALNCPYRQPGDIEIQKESEGQPSPELAVHTYGCQAIKATSPWMFITSPFLLREMLDEEVYNDMDTKVAGRNLDVKLLSKIVDYYVNGTDIAIANLTNIHQLPDVLASELTKKYKDSVMRCNKDCANCSICSNEYTRIMESKC